MAEFSEKKQERIQSPDQMDDYIKVITPSAWVALIALLVLLAGILAWSILGTVPAHDAEGNRQEVHPIAYVTN